MTAAILSCVATNSTRLLADVKALEGREPNASPSALVRLEAVIGRDFADRLVSALSAQPRQ